jgi:hypothetical protein
VEISSNASSPGHEQRPSLKEDRLRGVDAIADYIGETVRRTSYLLERRLIPAGKEGRSWVASKQALNRDHVEKTAGR